MKEIYSVKERNGNNSYSCYDCSAQNFLQTARRDKSPRTFKNHTQQYGLNLLVYTLKNVLFDL